MITVADYKDTPYYPRQVVRERLRDRKCQLSRMKLLLKEKGLDPSVIDEMVEEGQVKVIHKNHAFSYNNTYLEAIPQQGHSVMAAVLVNNFSNKKRETLSPIDMDFIFDAVCDYFNLDKEAVKGRSRVRKVLYARHIFAHLCVKGVKNLDLKTVGAFLGGRDHSTIINARQVVDDLLETDKAFRKDYNRIKSYIIGQDEG